MYNVIYKQFYFQAKSSYRVGQCAMYCWQKPAPHNQHMEKFPSVFGGTARFEQRGN